MSKRSNLGALLMALVVTGGLTAGIVVFVRELWPRLPAWLSMIVYVLLAVIVIGYPIYSLARWSDRYPARSSATKPDRGGARKNKDEPSQS